MANTYSQIYLHFVFAVQNRISLINPKWQTDLYKYMSGIISNNGHKMFAINGMPDHVHALVSMNPKQSPSDLMHDVKRSSSLWINENRLVMGNFLGRKSLGFLATEILKSLILPITSNNRRRIMKNVLLLKNIHSF